MKHDLFMTHAFLVALNSKDPKTKVGAIIVKNNEIISTGYNKMPKGTSDLLFFKDDDSNIFDSKHSYVIHAERVAILNSDRDKLKGATIYTTLLPCNICCQEIVESGITEIIYRREKKEKVLENILSKSILKYGDVKIINYGDISKRLIKEKIDGKCIWSKQQEEKRRKSREQFQRKRGNNI